MRRQKPTPRPDVIVVPHRASRLPKGFVPPLLVMILAVVGLSIRAMNPDWRGLTQEAGGRIGSLFASRAAAPARPIAAKVNPAPPKPDLAVAVKPAPEPPKVATPKPAPAPAAWDEIRRDAEKAKADRAEVERIKAKADEELANAPMPPPRRNRNNNPAAMRMQQEAVMRQMQALMADHQNEFDRMVLARRAQQERFLREFRQNGPRGFGGFDRMPPMPRDFFNAPLPGMERMIPPPPLPGQPDVKEESGEEVRNGVKRTWRTRTFIMRSNGGGVR